MTSHVTKSGKDWINDGEVSVHDTVIMDQNNNKVKNIRYLRDAAVHGVAGNCYTGAEINPDGFQYYEVTNYQIIDTGKTVTLIDPSADTETNVGSASDEDLRYRWCDIWGVMAWSDTTPSEYMPGGDFNHLMKFLRYKDSSAVSTNTESRVGYVMGRYFTGPGQAEYYSDEEYVLRVIGDDEMELYFWVNSAESNRFQLHWDYGGGNRACYSLVIRFGPKWDTEQ